MLDALLLLHKATVQMPTSNTATSLRISQDTRFSPWFDHCIGALDGTHIAVSVPTSHQPRYRNRKQYISQNVLAVCNFELLFVYVLPGWEGSAHDQRVLSDALCKHGFHIPIGKYYLGDAGYANSEGVMVPYRGTRYHLKEQRQANLK